MRVLKTKECANSECNEIFEYKNPKKRFCCLGCKNQAAYTYKQTKYGWEMKIQKAMRKNMQIIEYLFGREIYKVLKEELNKMGYDFNAAYLPFHDNTDRTIYRYGNLGICVTSKTECEIIKL